MSEDVDFEQLSGAAPPIGQTGADGLTDLRRLSAVPVELSVEIGRARMSVGETLELREGSVVTLDRMAGEPVDLLVNGIAIARGEVVVIDEQFGLRLTQVLTSAPGSSSPGMATGEPLVHASMAAGATAVQSVPDAAPVDVAPAEVLPAEVASVDAEPVDVVPVDVVPADVVHAAEPAAGAGPAEAEADAEADAEAAEPVAS
ncbi:MAG: flagellar motor switch protein FliN [Solirubrobacteraceae bacterium]